MIEWINKQQEKFSGQFLSWSKQYHHRIIVFNLFIVVLFLLHSVGYFHPYLPISINLIVILAFILSIFLLGAKSKTFFVIALVFWGITAFFKSMGVEVWAERSGIYVFEALIIGVIVLLFEKQ